MGLYSSKTKKGNSNSVRGHIQSKSFECDKFTVDKEGRAFQIELTDYETEKTHSINLYGDEILDLHKALDTYVKLLNK